MKKLLKLLVLLLPVSAPSAPSLALMLKPDVAGLLTPLFASDAQDNLIVAGMVNDCSRPVLNPISTCGGYWIAKYDPTGSTMLFATYLGDPYTHGVRGAGLRDMRVDLNGNIVLLSNATQNVLPAVNAIQSSVRGGTNLHLCSLSPDGSKIRYGTYLGGSTNDFPTALALDSSGAAYINVINNSGDFPVPPGNPSGPVAGEFVLVKVSADGNLIYVANFHPQYEGGALSVDASGSAELSTLNGIIRFSPDGSTVKTTPIPQWNTTFVPVTVPAPDGGFWMAGSITDAQLPVTSNALQPSNLLNPYLRVKQGIVYQAPQPLTGFGVNAFAVDPFERFRIYAATATGLFKSEDNGWIWTQIYPSAVQAVLVDPFDQNTLYISTKAFSPDGYLFRSKDRGQTWTPMAAGLAANFGNFPIVLAADPNTQGKLYVTGGPFYHSEDGGQTWSGGWSGGWAPPLPQLIEDPHNPYDAAIGVAVDSTTANRVYVLATTTCICPGAPSFNNLSRSDDGGAAFNFLKYGFTPQVDPSTGDVFAPNLSAAGQITVFRGGDFSNPQVLSSPGNIIAMAFDPENPGTMYVSLDTGAIFVSTDGGQSFQNFVTVPTPAAILAVGAGGVLHLSQVAHSTDGFAFKFDPLGGIVYGTYFGGGTTQVRAAALASNGHIFLAGSTGPSLPLANAIQPVFGGGSTDAFLAELDAAGGLVSSTYLGGPGDQEIDSITVLADGSILAVGSTATPAPYTYPQFPMLWRIVP